jgi:sugar phosphate isomerase/epimerase
MKIGISTWAYQDLPLAEALEKISELSGRAEILCEARHSLLDRENLEALESFSLDFTVHGLVTDVNIASVYPELRKASVQLHRRAVEASARAGAELYVIHPGYVAWGSCKPRALSALEESLSELARLEEDLDIRLAVENMPKSDWLFFNRPGLNLKGMGLVLDVGHAHTCDTLAEFIECSDVAHVHLHDNAGEKDEHLPLGQGGINFSPVLKMVEEKGIAAVLEHKNEHALFESLKAIESY